MELTFRNSELSGLITGSSVDAAQRVDKSGNFAEDQSKRLPALIVGVHRKGVQFRTSLIENRVTQQTAAAETRILKFVDQPNLESGTPSLDL